MFLSSDENTQSREHFFYLNVEISFMTKHVRGKLCSKACLLTKLHCCLLSVSLEVEHNNNKQIDLSTCFRLFWPKSRCYDYLYQEAEALLKNFPVQATISFYEDSDSEDDEDDLEQDSRTELSLIHI